MSFITTKFHEILLSGFRGAALTRKTGLTDWLTDWLTDGRVKNIPFATRCVGYNDSSWKPVNIKPVLYGSLYQWHEEFHATWQFTSILLFKREEKNHVKILIMFHCYTYIYVTDNIDSFLLSYHFNPFYAPEMEDRGAYCFCPVILSFSLIL